VSLITVRITYYITMRYLSVVNSFYITGYLMLLVYYGAVLMNTNTTDKTVTIKQPTDNQDIIII